MHLAYHLPALIAEASAQPTRLRAGSPVTTDGHKRHQDLQIDDQIADCHRMIEAQSDQLAAQVRAGADPAATRASLYRLKETLIALEASKAAFAVDFGASATESFSELDTTSRSDK